LRIYPGPCADTPSGAFEFEDLSMEEALGIPLWSNITGDVVHEYLESMHASMGFRSGAGSRQASSGSRDPGLVGTLWCRQQGQSL
jgi:hypothetical protein